MSGLNKKKGKKSELNRLLAVGGSIYVFLILAFLLLMFFFPNIYNAYSTRQVDSIKGQIATAIKNGGTKDDFTAVSTDNPIQLVVMAEGEIIYSNITSENFLEFSSNIRSDVILYESVYPVTSDSDDYKIWLLVYNKIAKPMLMTLFVFFTIFIIILSIVIAIAVRAMFARLVLPLQRLRENIKKLKEYKLNDINTSSSQLEFDILSEDLTEFTYDLKKKMDDVETTYTILEKDLMASQEENAYKAQLVSSLIHDLKTPLNIVQLSTYKMKKQKIYDEGTINKIDEKNEGVLDNINEILEIMYSNEIDKDKVSNINVVSSIKDMLKLLSVLFEERSISFDLKFDEEINILINKIELKSIIHNALINIYHYALENTKCEIQIKKSDKVILLFKNKVADINNVNFENAFNLFQSSKKQGTHGSGVGMYVIKNIVQKNEGACSFYQEDGQAVLEVALPLKEGEVE